MISPKEKLFPASDYPIPDGVVSGYRDYARAKENQIKHARRDAQVCALRKRESGGLAWVEDHYETCQGNNMGDPPIRLLAGAVVRYFTPRTVKHAANLQT